MIQGKERERPLLGIDKTREGLEDILMAGVKALGERLQNKLNDSTAQAFKKLELSITTDNEKAKQKLEDDLKAAQNEPDFLRDEYIKFLINTHNIFLKARIELLEDFKKRYSL